MHASKLAQVIVAGALAITMVGVIKAAAADEPGSCGEYKYWKDGGCVDARSGCVDARRSLLRRGPTT